MDFNSDVYIKRLARYYRRLVHLRQYGVLRVSSEELATHIKISPSQVRTDLSKLGVGQSGYGYRINNLIAELEKLLGVDKRNNMILVGVGKLGQALLTYNGFSKYSFDFMAAFDINPQLQGETFGMLLEPVKSIKELPYYLATHKVSIAALAVDPESVQSVVDILVAGGVKGIWNFAPRFPEVPDGVVIENVHIQESLLKLSFRLEESRVENNLTN